MFTSDLAPVAVGGTTVPAAMLDACQDHGERTALLDDVSNRRLTFNQLAHQTDRVGAALTDRGLRRGDVVAIWAPNQPEWMSAALGAMAAGCVVTGVNVLCTDPEVEHQLAATGAVLLITAPALAERARKLAALTSVGEVVVMGEPLPQTTPFSDLLKSYGASPDLGSITEDDIAIRPMSSGTTGLPKQVDITHGAIVTMLRQIAATVSLGQGDAVLGLAPFPYVMGMFITGLGPLFTGATVVTAPKFNPERFLPSIVDHKVTMVVAPPMLAGLLASHPAATPEALAAVRLIGFGGAPTPEARIRAVASRFPQITVGQGYGLTELTCVAAVLRPADPGPPESVGRLVPNTELRVVDPDTGLDLGPGETGELWIRGPQMMVGYRDNPEATAATIDTEGWLHTGDLGWIDEHGYLYVVGRIKELIKVKGFQVAPAELEAVLMSDPSVADAAVISVDVDGDEAPVAFVVPSAGSNLDPDEIKARVADQVSPYKRLNEVHLIDAIPRNFNGKVVRRRLKESLEH